MVINCHNVHHVQALLTTCVFIRPNESAKGKQRYDGSIPFSPLTHLQKSDRGSGHTQAERVHPNAPTFTLSERHFALAKNAVTGRLLSDSFWIFYKLSLDMLCRPFKDLEWHKGKKTRHRRRLSLLLKGLLATKPVVIFSRVRQTPFETRRPVSLCALLRPLASHPPIEIGGAYPKSLSVRRRIA